MMWGGQKVIERKNKRDKISRLAKRDSEILSEKKEG